jgi:hypothetical protein
LNSTGSEQQIFLKRCNPFQDSAGDEEFLGNLSGYWLVKNVDAWRWL